MALQRDTLYAGRFSTATSAHPQGAFKNRTTPTAQDGSYLEAQWLNDWDGFFGSLLNKAGLTPDGNVDAVGASQYFTALQTIISGQYVTAGGTANTITLADTSVTTYTDGMPLRFKVTSTNTGATTLNVNGVGAVTVYGSAGLACQGGELAPGLATLVYSTALTGFVIVHCTGGNKQVPDATKSHHAVSLGQLDTASGLKSLTISVTGNAITATLATGTLLSFRSPTLTDGTAYNITTSSPLTFTGPQGASFGSISGIEATYAVIALYNGGSPVLGWVNLAGGVDLSESNLLTTTAVSASSTNASVVYSTVAVTNSPFIIVGYTRVTEATAGTWVTAPSLVQPVNNQNTVMFGKRLTSTAFATTSGTSISITGVPTWAKRISIIFDDVKTASASAILVQVGSSSIITTGYTSSSTSVSTSGSNSTGAQTATTGFVVFNAVAGMMLEGKMWLDILPNSVIEEHLVNAQGGNAAQQGGGKVALTGGVTQLVLTTVAGNVAFSGGAITMVYEG